MFDKKIELPWKRTGDKEYPESGTICLIYFAFTGFSISQYIEEPSGIDYGDGKTYMCHSFEDAGGFLGGEDVLWIPLTQLPPIGAFRYLKIPEAYADTFKDCPKRREA